MLKELMTAKADVRPKLSDDRRQTDGGYPAVNSPWGKSGDESRLSDSANANYQP
jgi:hypothetical protein